MAQLGESLVLNIVEECLEARHTQSRPSDFLFIFVQLNGIANIKTADAFRIEYANNFRFEKQVVLVKYKVLCSNFFLIKMVQFISISCLKALLQISSFRVSFGVAVF